MKRALLPLIVLLIALGFVPTSSSGPPADRKGAPPEEAVPESWSGKVIGIHDGDSLTVLKDGRTQVKVRLVAIDAPERGQEFGRVAKEMLSELTFGKLVHVHPSGKDKYGRTLARVTVRNRDVNYTMVSRGYAWHYRKYSDNERLQKAEARAKKKGRGLWAAANAMAPWEFRKIAPKEKAARIAAEQRPRPATGTKAEKPEPKKTTDPALTHWITFSSRKRHNASCRWYARSKGRKCTATEGIACKICGG